MRTRHAAAPHSRSTHLLHREGGPRHLLLAGGSCAVRARLVLGITMVAVKLITASTFGGSTFEAQQAYAFVLCLIVFGWIEEFTELFVLNTYKLGRVLQALYQGEGLFAHVLGW